MPGIRVMKVSKMDTDKTGSQIKLDQKEETDIKQLW